MARFNGKRRFEPSEIKIFRSSFINGGKKKRNHNHTERRENEGLNLEGLDTQKPSCHVFFSNLLLCNNILRVSSFPHLSLSLSLSLSYLLSTDQLSLELSHDLFTQWNRSLLGYVSNHIHILSIVFFLYIFCCPRLLVDGCDLKIATKFNKRDKPKAVSSSFSSISTCGFFYYFSQLSHNNDSFSICNIFSDVSVKRAFARPTHMLKGIDIKNV